MACVLIIIWLISAMRIGRDPEINDRSIKVCKLIPVVNNVPICNIDMINAYIRNRSTYLMPCIFGFDFHETLCPCGLINVKDSELDILICSDCTEKFRLDYNDFLSHEKENWTGDFEV